MSAPARQRAARKPTKLDGLDNVVVGTTYDDNRLARPLRLLARNRRRVRGRGRGDSLRPKKQNPRRADVGSAEVGLALPVRLMCLPRADVRPAAAAPALFGRPGHPGRLAGSACLAAGPGLLPELGLLHAARGLL